MSRRPASGSSGGPVPAGGKGRRRIQLTPTGRLFLGMSLLFYLASLTSQSGLLLLLIGVFLGCFLVNLTGAWRGLRHLEIIAPQSVHLSEGERLSQPWRVANRGDHPAGFISVDSPRGPLFRLAILEPMSQKSLLPEARFDRRGVYPHSRIEMASTFPFGLLRAVTAVSLPGEVVVFPAIYETPSPRAGGFDVVVGGKHKGNRRTSSGALFAGIRPIQPADPLKSIHWPASAKGLGLMAKSFEEELSGRTAFIMDCGHSGDPKLLDDCARATGSLIFAALDAGHHAEWMDLSSLNPVLIPPFSDGHEILETLARVELEPDCVREDRLHPAVDRIGSRNAVCLVLTVMNPPVRQLIERLLRENRRVALYLPEHVAAPDDLPGVTLWSYSARAIWATTPTL